MSETPEPRPFDLAGPLPAPGVTVLEASAGTGKTYTLTSLVARYVAAGFPLTSILAVTFTRMATGEMRARVRHRIAEVRRLLDDPETCPDPVVTAITALRPAEVEASRERLGEALSEFDGATIATTHAFCQTVLRELGTAGDAEPGCELLEDPTDLLDRIVDDLYLGWALRRSDPLDEFPLRLARSAATAAVRNPQTGLYLHGASLVVSQIAAKARGQLAKRLLAGGTYTYDGLLMRVAQVLRDPERGPEACRRLRARHRVVLVDEFQDTDPTQWEILRTAFGDGAGTVLILIGDPKQAVYGFRGADVYSYLDAAGGGSSRFTLASNWRSDQPLLDALEALLSPCQFGHPDIPFRSVRAVPGHGSSALGGAPVAAPLRFRVADDRIRGVEETPTTKLMSKPSLEAWVADDMARDVAGLIASGATLALQGREVLLEPRHVAVLVRTNPQARLARDALVRAGVAAVVSGSDSVFLSDAAEEWVRLLEAVAAPASAARAAALALTSFGGMTAEEVALADEGVWEEQHDRLHRWAAVLASSGVAVLYRTVVQETGLAARVLGRVDGERLLTDLDHVAELLHAEASGRPGGFSVLSWLRDRRARASGDKTEADERSRKLETDREAVQVLTIHRAKGLEFPVVYCPYLWVGPRDFDQPVVFHDGSSRMLDVGCLIGDRAGANEFRANKALSEAEAAGEELRLLYVALTRAAQQVVLWWGKATRSQESPLARILLCRNHADGAVKAKLGREPHKQLILDALADVASRAPGLVSIEEAGVPVAAARSIDIRPESPAPSLSAAQLGRDLDDGWRRSSYTSLTASAHAGAPVLPAALVTSEPDATAADDEPDSAAGPPSDGASPEDPLPMSSLGVGRAFGTMVHRLLQDADFTVPDAFADAGGLGEALRRVLDTPLGELTRGLRLNEVGRQDRVNEMAFELPLLGGDAPTGRLRMSDIRDLLSQWLPDGPPEAAPEPGPHGRPGEVPGASPAAQARPLAGYGSRLDDPELAGRFCGYLTGSIDLLLRDPRTQRWFVVDYKTNWLGDKQEDYRFESLDAEMQRRHYPLQGLLYSVAAQRYLKLRVPSYEASEQFGGILFLFLRGMTGRDTPCIGGHTGGVWSWRPPDGLVAGLSDLLAHGPSFPEPMPAAVAP